MDAEVGTVSATDPDDDALTYSITEGNDDGTFAVDGEGVVTVAGPLNHETVASYTLTVEADDGRGGTAEAAVAVTVTDVAEDAPPAPENLRVTLADDVFTLTWTAVSGADRYEAQVTTDAADAATVTWAALPETTALTQTYTPAGGSACGTTYRFRVRSNGDGAAYVDDWGLESAAEPVTTDACNQEPVFGASAYDFFVQDTATTDDVVGAVSATDPDDGDTVSYAITDGNGDGKFAVNSSTGRLTAAGTDAFNLAATPYYALTIEASDGNGGTATARVTVALTIAACYNGAAVPRADERPRLVRDCSILLTAKDTLRGTASLNWSPDLSIDEWQGIYRGYRGRPVHTRDGRDRVWPWPEREHPARAGRSG